jgi:competence protein ComEC
MEAQRQITQRAPALVLLVGMIAGLSLSRVHPVDEIFFASGALTLALLSFFLVHRSKEVLWMLTILLSTVLGFWAYGTVRLPEKPDEKYELLPIREARLTLKIERIMQASDRFGRTTGVAKVLHAPDLSRIGQNSFVYFRLSRHDSAPAIGRGAIVELTGILQPIYKGEDISEFENFLNDSGIFYLFGRTSQLRIIRESSPFMQFCQQTNRDLQEYLRLGAPGESNLSNIYIAMLLGQKAELSPEQKDRFRETGTMHLFAISGLHIGVVAAVFAQILFLLRIPRPIRPLIGLPILYVYVEVTGAAPSAVRAFLMVAFFWASLVIQRQRSPLAALAASAVFVLLIQPNQLWQMGFQLSYLVVMSILLFGLPLHHALCDAFKPYKFIPESSLSLLQRGWLWMSDKLLMLFAISFAAWLASTPLSAGFFGIVASYAVLVNILLVNLAAIVISGGVISLLFALLTLTPVTSFLNHSAWLCISMMDTIVQLNLMLPSAVIHCPGFPKVLSYLAVVGYLTLLFTLQSYKNRFLRFAAPTIWILATLSLGTLLSHA